MLTNFGISSEVGNIAASFPPSAVKRGKRKKLLCNFYEELCCVIEKNPGKTSQEQGKITLKNGGLFAIIK